MALHSCGNTHWFVGYVRAAIGERVAVAMLTNKRSETSAQQTLLTFTEYYTNQPSLNKPIVKPANAH